MKEYIIRPFSRWEDVDILEISERMWTPPVDIAACAKIGWTEDALLVRLEAHEALIRAEETGPLGHPWEDSCLEFFLSPVAGDPRYINIEFNPNACCRLGLGDGRERIQLLPERNWLEPEVFTTPEGWGITYRVPFALLKMLFPAFQAAPGTVIRANCYKCGDKTAQPHFFSWNRIASETPNFHRPQDFGMMILG
ncbi:MAG: hypothetical protein IJQ33_01030 [Clostridia bacterium]|nr:hypothetical protein [Clostridia bacterium]